MSRSTHRRRAGLLVVVCCLILAACGSSTTEKVPGKGEVAAETEAAEAKFPLTITSKQGPVTIAAEPKAIVSLSPSATETLFAVGAGKQVIAVDDQSNFPAEAPKTDLSGYKPNIEAIAAKKPDLVVMADDLSGVAPALGKLNIPVLIEPAPKTLEEAYGEIEQIAEATGHASEGKKLAKSMRTSIDKQIADAAKRTTPVRIYHELDDQLYSVTSSTFIGQLYKQLGATNIADAADKDASGYPQLSAEYVVKADPQAIFLADAKCCKQSAETLAARPGFSGISAIKTGSVIPLDEDIASRWGPRLVDFVGVLSGALAKVPVT